MTKPTPSPDLLSSFGTQYFLPKLRLFCLFLLPTGVGFTVTLYGVSPHKAARGGAGVSSQIPFAGWSGGGGGGGGAYIAPV